MHDEKLWRADLYIYEIIKLNFQIGFKLFFILDGWYDNFSTLGLIDPMLLYGFEILGYENLDDIDRVYLNFLTHILI